MRRSAVAIFEVGDNGNLGAGEQSHVMYIPEHGCLWAGIEESLSLRGLAAQSEKGGVERDQKHTTAGAGKTAPSAVVKTLYQELG